jgi:curved DNA-binding protein CbpA
MIFKDYYKILEIEPTASSSEIKIAFKKQAIKWHPDKNPGADTTAKMQDLNEAYLILKDNQARVRYDIEYTKFKSFEQETIFEQEPIYERRTYQKSDYYNQNQKDHSQRKYEFDDDLLKKWMKNARVQAVDLAIQTIKEMGNLSVTATKAAGTNILLGILGYTIGGFIIYLGFRACGF